ncbi:MAG: tRNA (guanosine(18)-2'-O)-methyltransferase TrmH [Gemmatimonadota bacterium]|nr:tRNA (guanosine(18)-2'-O)-methyltransferase TrmH [Gemmatimonadota bacterium]
MRTETNKEKRFRKIKAVLDRRQPDLTILMDNVHKSHNLAAILRTCDAVGIPTIHAVAYHDQVGVRRAAASGSHKWVDLVIHKQIETAYETLRERGCRILVAHPGPGGQDFRSVDYTQPTAIVVGAEMDGLSHKAVTLADGCIFIPTYGMVDSLNVSVATAVILFEAHRQRRDAGMYDQPQLDLDTRQSLLFEYTYPTAVARCKKLGIPYPKLDDDGEVIPTPDYPLGTL